MATPYDVLKAKWKQRQDTDTTVFGATRDEAVTKIKNLAQEVRFLPPPLHPFLLNRRTIN